MFITDAIMHGMPPHIAQLVAGHRDINTTMGYKAVYPEEVINGHRAFISRRRALRPGEEYRVPTDEEWDRVPRPLRPPQGGPRRLRPLLRHALHPRAQLPALPAPAARPRRPIPAGRDPRQPHRRIAEAESNRWLGEAEGLKVSLDGAREKLAQMDQIADAATRPSTSASPPSPTPPAAPARTRPASRTIPDLAGPAGTSPQFQDHFLVRRR